MKMIIDWDTVVAMSEEVVDPGDSLGIKKKMVDLDDLYSVGEKMIECDECVYQCAFSNNMCVKNGLHTCPEDRCCREGKIG